MRDSFSNIIGHERTIHRLKTALDNASLPHAMLFYGPRHLGKRTMAFSVATALLGAETPDTHPDFRLVERGRDDKTGKLKKRISIAEVRGLREHLRMSSLLGGYKVAIINNAELLSDEAANGLLKTLEEPSPKTIIIMVSHDVSKMLATVKSRAALFPLSRMPDDQLVSALGLRGMSESEAGRLAHFAAGRPGIALALREDGDMLNWYLEQERLWNSLQSEPLYRRFSLLAELAPPRSDREEVVGKLKDVLALWETFLQRELRQGSTQAVGLLEKLTELRGSLEANVQPRLLLERFAFSFEPSL